MWNQSYIPSRNCAVRQSVECMPAQGSSTIGRENQRMPWTQFAAVGVGAACGAWLRWGFSLLLNPLYPSLPLGTLTSNLVGGFIIGMMMALAEPLHLSVTMRLLLITGFLGGLTTFSTFSAETMNLI